MEIKDAQYMESTSDWGAKAKAIEPTIHGEDTYLPISEANLHNEEIMKQVKAGTLTIKDAD